MHAGDGVFPIYPLDVGFLIPTSKNAVGLDVLRCNKELTQAPMFGFRRVAYTRWPGQKRDAVASSFATHSEACFQDRIPKMFENLGVLLDYI